MVVAAGRSRGIALQLGLDSHPPPPPENLLPRLIGETEAAWTAWEQTCGMSPLSPHIHSCLQAREPTSLPLCGLLSLPASLSLMCVGIRACGVEQEASSSSVIATDVEIQEQMSSDSYVAV